MALLQIPHEAWVLIGDGQKALILKNEGDAEVLNLRRLDVQEQDNPPTRELGTDRPGRLADGSSSHRSATEPTDFHSLEEQRFAVSTAERINRAAHENAFRHIVIVATPRTLGALRKQLSKEAQQRVIAEIDRDLTKHPIPEIEKLLREHHISELPVA